MNADGEAVLFGGPVDRPEHALAERLLAHRHQQHLHETWVGRAAVDLVDGPLDALGGDDDRRAQARITIEPLGADPVIDGLGERRAQVLVADQLQGVEAIADGEREVVGIEQRLGGAASVLVGTEFAVLEIGPGRERSVVRIGDGVKTVDAADLDGFAPVVVHITGERGDARHARMHVAVDRA